MTGAARLAAQACARIGAGLVTVAAPASAWPIYAAALTSVMVHPLRESGALDEILADARINAVVVGSGAGISDTTQRTALKALASQRSVVLVAVAINSFGSDPLSIVDALQDHTGFTPPPA